MATCYCSGTDCRSHYYTVTPGGGTHIKIVRINEHMGFYISSGNEIEHFMERNSN